MTDQVYIVEILKVFGPALYLLPAIAYIFFFWSRRDREKFEREMEFKHRELSRQDYLDHEKGRDIDRDERYSPRLLEELASRISHLDETLDARVRDSISVQLNHVLPSMTKAVSDRSVSNRGPDDHGVTRDLSHALNTPLSQIDTATSTALTMIGKDQDEKAFLESILASVQICKAFLGAYRELASVSVSSGVWSPKSLKEALDSAGHVYAARIGKFPQVDVDLPPSIDGYSNNYIVALVFPVLENAIESSKPDTSVTVGLTEESELVTLTITNEPCDKPGGDEIYEFGETTKEGHEGIGLSSVRYLLSGHRGARVSHQYVAPFATFSISLPRRAS